MTTPHPIVSTLTNGIVKELHEVRKARLYRATLVLLYCAIDQVGFLGAPVTQKKASKGSFIAWSDKYLVPRYKGLISSKDLWEERCSFVHQYGAGDANPMRKCFAYVVGGRAAALHDPAHPQLVVVEISALVDSFIWGVQQFTADLEKHSDAAFVEAVNQRLHDMPGQFPLDEEE